MADEKTIQRRPRGTPIDRCVAIMRDMDEATLRDFALVVRGFVAHALVLRGSALVSEQTMLELGEDAAKGGE